MIGVILACLSSVAFGASVVFTRLGVQSIKPTTATLIALISSLAIVLVATLVAEFKELASISLAAVGWFALVGIIQFSLARNFFFHGVKYIGASRSTAVTFSYPLFTVLLAILFLQEEVSAMLLIGVVMIVGGLVLLLTERAPERKIMTSTNVVAGYGFSLASAICYGIAMVIIKWGVSQMATPLAGASVSLAGGVLGISLISGRGLKASLSSDRRAVGMLLLSGACSAAGVMFLYTAFSKASAVVVTPLNATGPLITLLLTYLFLRRLESPTIFVVLGCFIVVAGSVLVVLQ